RLRHQRSHLLDAGQQLRFREQFHVVELASVSPKVSFQGRLTNKQLHSLHSNFLAMPRRWVPQPPAPSNRSNRIAAAARTLRWLYPSARTDSMGARCALASACTSAVRPQPVPNPSTTGGPSPRKAWRASFRSNTRSPTRLAL